MNPIRDIHFTDDLEKDIAELLHSRGIPFVHESESKEQTLDFYLPTQQVFIEVKQFHCERTIRQLSSQDNVILVQGRKSVAFLKLLFNK